MLIAMAGLPGTGKSTLARAVGREIGAPVLAVDAVVAAMWRTGVGGPGSDVATGLAAYGVVHTLAGELLDAGLSVVVDAVNAVEPARQAWRDLAAAHDVPLRWIEVRLDDDAEHHRRLSARGTRYAGFREPTWAEVRAREVEPWEDERLVVDAARPLDTLVAAALAHVTRS